MPEAGRPGPSHWWTRGLGASRDEEVWSRTDVRRSGHRPGHHVHVLVIGDDSHGIAHALAEDMAEAFPNLCLDRISGPHRLGEYDATLGPDDHVVLAIATCEVADIDETIRLTDSMPILAFTRWLVVTDRPSHTDLTRATQSGRLASVTNAPWSVPLLIGQCYSTMVRHLRGEGRSTDQIIALIGDPPPSAVQGPLVEGLGLSEHQVVLDLLAGVERVLGRRPRIVVPAGTRLVAQGEPVAAVHLVLDGDVSLHRDSARGEVLAHHASSGPLIGLVSLARAEEAFFTGVTTSETTLVRLTTEQLQIALHEDPSIGSTLTALAIRSLTRRLMRAEDLHLENAMLADDLEEQKEQLAGALEDLRRTRAELVDRARFAMLGELSAGIAHELNNPVTALTRSAEHLAEDVDALLGSSSQTSRARRAMTQALHAAPMSTADERALVARILGAAGGDRGLARRLVRAGARDEEEARRLVEADPGLLGSVESGARVGSSLRAILSASDRVVELTQSLKGYARPDAHDARPVDVRVGVDDVLRLTRHRLRDIEVDCDYCDAPPVVAHPGRLEQVWTNLIVNAAEAIEDEAADLRATMGSDGNGGAPLPARGDEPARIRVSVRHEGDRVVVSVCDNGPGIDPAIIEKIVEPRFTTKAGRVRFGLGMGMSIVRSIVSDHGGSLSIESRPGDTAIRVSLPTAGTPTTDEEEHP
ncbi:ATP-binding protein [Actinomyces sp. B33]|uniref:sensor histidine kinase n=1 Tax=Actinomyces sp. B33 TaxID=2942131 RepID=UPI0023401151|nr:ATP-binding protein [Actinomyces sp. B33]MDC4233947.1 ATP-binding protein [Actinomyces sp. B33]